MHFVCTCIWLTGIVNAYKKIVLAFTVPPNAPTASVLSSLRSHDPPTYGLGTFELYLVKNVQATICSLLDILGMFLLITIAILRLVGVVR